MKSVSSKCAVLLALVVLSGCVKKEDKIEACDSNVVSTANSLRSKVFLYNFSKSVEDLQNLTKACTDYQASLSGRCEAYSNLEKGNITLDEGYYGDTCANARAELAKVRNGSAPTVIVPQHSVLPEQMTMSLHKVRTVTLKLQVPHMLNAVGRSQHDKQLTIRNLNNNGDYCVLKTKFSTDYKYDEKVLFYLDKVSDDGYEFNTQDFNVSMKCATKRANHMGTINVKKWMVLDLKEVLKYFASIKVD